MTTINYDLPVEDLVDALSATGHVTHGSFAKTSVTFHHNGGVGDTHEDVLNTWKTRPASAHFDVDASGMIAQYVNVNEYAWAVGDQNGNTHSISIEMADFTGDPNWEVSEVTWKAAARLAAWLFVNVIGTRPDSSNVFPHQHWSSTDCPGPWVMHNFSSIIAEVQSQYDAFLGSSSPSPSPAPQKSVQDLAHEVINGQWGNDPERTQRLTAAGYDASAVQAEVNRELNVPAPKPPTPVPTPPPAPAPAPRKTVVDLAHEVIAGKWGNGADRIQRLSSSGYDAGAVQAEVNRELGYGAPHPQKSIGQLAAEVINGQWGNGAERVARLKAAGYNAAAVQQEVNRRLS